MLRNPTQIIRRTFEYDTISVEEFKDKDFINVRLFGSKNVGYLSKSSVQVGGQLAQSNARIVGIFIETKEPEDLFNLMMCVSIGDHPMFYFSAQVVDKINFVDYDLYVPIRQNFNVGVFGPKPKNDIRVYLIVNKEMYIQ